MKRGTFWRIWAGLPVAYLAFLFGPSNLRPPVDALADAAPTPAAVVLTVKPEATPVPEPAPFGIAAADPVPAAPEKETPESAAQTLAKLAAGYDDVLKGLEAREKELMTRALMQTVLNRVDSGSYKDTVRGVVTEKKQFDRYSEQASPTDAQLRWARETVAGWQDEQSGRENAYRVLPGGYVYIKISNGRLYFSEIFRFEEADVWGWGLPLPQEQAMHDGFQG